MAGLSYSTAAKSAPDLSAYIQQLWEKHRAGTMARLEVLEHAIAELLKGSLLEEELKQAIRETHKLAGSLGSYGLPKGSELARRAELLLESGEFGGGVLLELSEDALTLRTLIEEGPPHNEVAEIAPTPAAAAETPDIVLVEDDLLLRDLLVHAFSLHSLTYKDYVDGDTALQELTAEHAVRPKVLLLDIDLPGTSGMTILRELAATGATKKINILMLTARNTEAEVMNSLRLGAIDHVSKPFSVPILLEKIHRALS